MNFPIHQGLGRGNMIIITKSGKKFNNTGDLPIGYCPHCGYEIVSGCFYKSGYWECTQCREIGDDDELDEPSELAIREIEEYCPEYLEGANFHIENGKYIMNE